ncbi:hypothetical protein V8G54_030430, partial [Vigna mungo]
SLTVFSSFLLSHLELNTPNLCSLLHVCVSTTVLNCQVCTASITLKPYSVLIIFQKFCICFNAIHDFFFFPIICSDLPLEIHHILWHIECRELRSSDSHSSLNKEVSLMSSSSNSVSDNTLRSTSTLKQVSSSRYSQWILQSTKPSIPLTSPVSPSDEHHSSTSTFMLPSTTSFVSA